MDKIRNIVNLEVIEFYFDDDLDLHIMVKNKPPSKYPLRHIRFEELVAKHKRNIIKILRLFLD